MLWHSATSPEKDNKNVKWKFLVRLVPSLSSALSFLTVEVLGGGGVLRCSGGDDIGSVMGDGGGCFVLQNVICKNNSLSLSPLK